MRLLLSIANPCNSDVPLDDDAPLCYNKECKQKGASAMAITQVKPFANGAGSEQTTNYDDVRHQIETWPSAERARLAQYIITTLEPEAATNPRKRNSVAEIYGRMAVEGVPAPSDDEVDRMLDESRLERYG